MTSVNRIELIAAAAELHDREGCSCDRKYLMSCPNMANAILRSGPGSGAAGKREGEVMDIAEFVKARLDEDEAAAKANLGWMRFEAKPGDWSRLMCDPVMGPFGGQTATRNVATGLYVGRISDPARVLREVAAKRAHLSQWMDARAQVVECGRAGDDAGRSRWEAVALALTHVVVSDAAVWSGHPDYRAEWKP